MAVSVTGWPGSGLAEEGVIVTFVGIRIDDLGQDGRRAGAEEDVAAVGRGDRLGSDRQTREVQARQLETPAALVVTGELPRRRSPAKKETDPVGLVPDVGVTTAVNCTACPKREPAGTRTRDARGGGGGGSPPGQPDLDRRGSSRRWRRPRRTVKVPVDVPASTKYSAPGDGVNPFSNTGSALPASDSVPLVIRP